VRIQCERCSTTYAFDEARLPPSGAAVRCTRCGHVFRAFPASAGEKTWLGQPPGPEVADARGAPRSLATPLPSAPAEAPPEPPQPAPGDITVSGIAADIRSRRRRAWIWPLLLAVAGAGGTAGWLAWQGRVPTEALELRAAGDRLLVRDDRASLEQAAAKFGEAVAIAPAYGAARADEALALLLLADDAAAEAGPAEERFRELEARRALEERDRAPGWSAREADLVKRMSVVQAEAQPARERSRALRERAVSLLRGLTQGGKGNPDISRVLAVYYGLDGEAERAAEVASRAPKDPWVPVALGAAALKRHAGMAPDVAASLSQVVASHPEILRAQIILGLSLYAQGRRDAAVAALDAILGANPEHERAKALKAEILAPPAPAMPPVAVPAGAPPPQPTGKLPRLRAGERRASASRGG